MRKLILVGLLGFFAVSGCQLPSKAHFEYDKKAYSLVGETLKKYIESDPNLTEQQKKDRLAAIEEWKNVIEDNLKE